jgi:hypothetical protein
MGKESASLGQALKRICLAKKRMGVASLSKGFAWQTGAEE